ncbi:Flavodoxin/ferredoxin--NADP reductase [Buchnera aphidicola (Eriosoma grossulariae)]|uniref:FAD-binding oxidoreductase n=1 Tax=Buchnera aphidicola TaxID=9 RepID=UPI003464C63D
MNQWITGKIINIKKWNQNLFSIIIKAPINSFSAGQFAKLSVINDNKKIQRAYSYVNAPNNSNLEFYINLIPNGKFTNHLYQLKINQNIMINKHSFGFFTIDEIQNCEILWMMATGTGIGPYLSILQEGKWINKFNKIVLIYSVRLKKDLNYLDLIYKLKKQYKNKIIFVSIVTREQSIKSLKNRIPILIKNNTLEKKIKLNIDPKTSHVMLCGNPDMVKETQKVLQNLKNMQKNLRKSPGHITTENYW